MMKNLSLALVAAVLLVGCVETRTRYVAVPTVPELPVTPVLQACADHAAGAQRAAFEDFRALQLDTAGLVLTAPMSKVGAQRVGAVYDGQGSWYGAQEFRRIRFHCMVSPAGTVVYSFLRAQD